MTALPESLLKVPLAHRGLHDLSAGRPENSLAAIHAAIDAGYGVEIDIQPSSDRVAMVFHDYDLRRLTGERGPVSQRHAHELEQIPLSGGSEGIPTLRQVLDLVAGRVPLLLEVKDQDGTMGPAVGALERAIAEEIDGYTGDLALMSFNPNSVSILAELLPDRTRGLVTCDYSAQDWPFLPEETRDRLRGIPDFASVGASFISHKASDLASPHVAEIKSQGAAILCWTVKSVAEEAQARQIADNITFEGYAAAHTPA